MEPEIETFTSKINATSVRKLTQIQFNDAVGTNLLPLRIFRRENYFVLEKDDDWKFLIIKISRSKKPFLGVDMNILDRLNGSLNNYYLVLLESNKAGYRYSKSQLNWNIRHDWRIARDNNCKINYGTLSDENHFLSVGSFLTSELF